MPGEPNRRPPLGLIGLAVCVLAGFAAVAIWRQSPATPNHEVVVTAKLPAAPPIKPAPRLCDKENWSRLGPLVLEIGADEIFVDAESWQRKLVSIQVGLAAWMSKCIHEGRAIDIRAFGTRELLASYDATTGYELWE